MRRAQLHDNLLEFVLAGKSTFTVVNEATGSRMTFQVNKLPDHKKHSKSDPDIWFVRYMDGNDNLRSYSFIGSIRFNEGNIQFNWSKKSKYTIDSRPVKSFAWFIMNVASLPDQIQFWHEGRCGRCNRTLTVPHSIETGYGPECWKMIGALRQFNVLNKLADDILLKSVITETSSK